MTYIEKMVRALDRLHARAVELKDPELNKIVDLFHARLGEGASILGLDVTTLRSGGEPKPSATADQLEQDLEA